MLSHKKVTPAIKVISAITELTIMKALSIILLLSILYKKNGIKNTIILSKNEALKFSDDNKTTISII